MAKRTSPPKHSSEPSEPPPAAVPVAHAGPLMVSIGERLRQFRDGRFTIIELSRAAGVSSGRISEIERGNANPSFETLWRLANALGVPIGAFFAGPDPEAAMVVRRNQRKRLAIPHDDLEYELLTPDLQRSLELFIFHVPPNFDNSVRPITHVGEECIHILKGTLVVNVGGQEFVLAVGDTITYEASTPHFVCNRSGKVVSALAAVTPPSF
jgi:transcriptional regulator with XRE-family HTH domain